METFLILAAIVFMPFIWFIVRMLRFTDDTVGENSPIYRERTYQISAGQYFGTLTKGMLAFLGLQMLVFSYVLVGEAIRQQDWRILLPVLMFIAVAIFVVFYFYIDWQYWTITRNISLTLNPFDPSISVDEGDITAMMTPDVVDHIEFHLLDIHNGRHPLYGYGYYLFFCTEGTVVRINRLFFEYYTEFLERYFRYTPPTVIWQKYPWILPVSQVINQKNTASISK